MKKQEIALLCALLPALSTSGGCATAVVAGAAAAGGYIAHEKGYRWRNPLTKGEKGRPAETQEKSVKKEEKPK